MCCNARASSSMWVVHPDHCWWGVREHINNIRKGLKEHSVSKHFREVHGRDPKGLKFWGVEKVNHHWRGGNFKRTLSQLESSWVFETKVLAPRGLNVDFNLNCFIFNG